MTMCLGDFFFGTHVLRPKFLGVESHSRRVKIGSVFTESCTNEYFRLEFRMDSDFIRANVSRSIRVNTHGENILASFSFVNSFKSCYVPNSTEIVYQYILLRNIIISQET